jgi:RNA polymerase sigma factor (sigma-70 family)
MQQVQQAVPGEPSGPTDAELLERFRRHRDEAAFEALVRRHGPMVLAVCRRVLGSVHDAEDAFQATFLVLVRKAGSVGQPELLANWLYGVAHRTALEARSRAARRGARERQLQTMPHTAITTEPGDGDLRAVLDRELSRLPDKYRTAVVLCDLEQRSRDEVTRQLGIPAGTLSSRLAAGRKLLATRLRRRGLAVPGTALALLLSREAASAWVPATLVSSTVKAGVALAAGHAAAAAVIPAKVASLTEGVVRTMLLTKLKLAALFLVAVGALVGVGLPGYLCGGAQAPQGDDEPLSAAPLASAGGPLSAEPPEGEKGAPPDRARPDDRRIVGSGKLVTKEIDVSDFNAVAVGTAFRVEITRGRDYRAAVTTDDNVFPYVKATKDGSTLEIRLDHENRSIQTTALKVAITMPELEGVRASQAAHLTVKGFKSDRPFKARLSQAGMLDGEIEAGKLEVEASQAGHIKLKGSAREARLVGSQGSRLALGDFPVDRADVRLSQGSHATVRVKERLDYNLAQGSRLDYLGNPTVGRHHKSMGSSAGREGKRGEEDDD